MKQAQQGNTVRVHYTGNLTDGSLFDSSQDKDPLEFTIGAQEVLEDFERTVVGMAPGESKHISISAENAYGNYREDLVFELERNRFPEGTVPEVGAQVQLSDGADRQFTLPITRVNETTITVDANHPLAGKDLEFDITLIEIL